MKKIFSILFIINILVITACTNATTATTQTNVSNKDLLITELATNYFSDEAVPEEDIKDMLSAAISAQSGLNRQYWHFTAIANKELLAELRTTLYATMTDEWKKSAEGKAEIGDSPLAIVVSCTEKEELSAALATQKIVDYAMLSGYGAKVVASPAVVINRDYKEKLQIPEDMKAVLVVLIGKAKDATGVDGITSPTTRKSFDEVANIIK